MDARQDLSEDTATPGELIELADWRRRVVEGYADVRRAADPRAAWDEWCQLRADLFLHHPQSPFAVDARRPDRLPEYSDYDARYRVLAGVVTVDTASRVELPTSRGTTMAATVAGRAVFELDGTAVQLELYWLEGYAGGLLLPFRDATNGRTTYGSGRYLLDTAKGADLGVIADHLVLDFNFAYQPSCSYHESWSCPLPPRANWLPIDVPVGERTRRY